MGLWLYQAHWCKSFLVDDCQLLVPLTDWWWLSVLWLWVCAQNGLDIVFRRDAEAVEAVIVFFCWYISRVLILLSFPCVCPEPVLVKWSFFNVHMAQKDRFNSPGLSQSPCGSRGASSYIHSPMHIHIRICILLNIYRYIHNEILPMRTYEKTVCTYTIECQGRLRLRLRLYVKRLCISISYVYTLDYIHWDSIYENDKALLRKERP